ncbi:MAG: fructose-6-phosphate aldolase [Proteobacteria bacterium SG_bin7]|nr:MAG: fructose-6-phosphate aldolase [Proteobacteria bacterium SG_bin7]
MKFFIDTADVAEIKAAHDRGWVDGVTTNPSLIAKSGRPLSEVIKEICGIVNGPISAEVLSLEAKEMFREGLELAKIHKNVVVKVPMTEEGMVAVKKFSAEGIRTNVTLVFSPLQALLAAKAGAYLVSPFVGRLDDISYDGMKLIRQIRVIYDNYKFKTEVLVASIRNPVHLVRSAMMGADVATIPFSVMKQMTHHPLTDKGIEKFLADAKGKK